MSHWVDDQSAVRLMLMCWWMVTCCLCFRSSASTGLLLKLPESEPWSAGRASLLRDRLCGTVFLLLYGDQRCHCMHTFKWQLKAYLFHIWMLECSPLLGTVVVLLWFWCQIQNCRLTYLLKNWKLKKDLLMELPGPSPGPFSLESKFSWI